jgi:hypothetical protein
VQQPRWCVAPLQPIGIAAEMHKRPSPQQIKARQWEIKRRYQRIAKVGKRSRGMAAIRIAELMRWLHNQYGAGAELKPSNQSEIVIRIFTHHFIALPDGARRLTSWFDRYAPWLELRDREYLISEATHCPLKWSADRLAWKLRLTDAKRTELKITTIGAIDCNKDQRKARAKAKRKERDRLRYQAKRRSPSISV